MMEVKFFGTRGSLPSPINGELLDEKIVRILNRFKQEKPKDISQWLENLPFHEKSTYGGDTTCCYLKCGETSIVLDLGSGMREFGRKIIPEMLKNKGMKIYFFMTHVHWDHIQGFPFFGPLFIPRKFMLNNHFIFYGGTQWQKTLEEVLRGQMDPPFFPVEWQKVTSEGPKMDFTSVYDGFETLIEKEINIRARRLHHPNETYGWRIEYDNKIFVFATDTEPYAEGPDPIIIDLSKNADVLYLDCQFTKEQYIGKDGPPRMGWGHGYDKWCGKVAISANVRKLILGHHDPAATDEKVKQIEENVRKIFPNTFASFDGMDLII